MKSNIKKLDTSIKYQEKKIQEMKEKGKEISEKTQVKQILNLPATRVFKISANFKL